MNEIKYTPQVSSMSRANSAKGGVKAQKSQYSLERSPQKDIVDIQRARQERLKKRDRRNKIKGFIAGIAAASTMFTTGTRIVDQATSPHKNFNAQGHSVVETADFCDIDPRAIVIANSLDDEDETIEDIVLPERYETLSEDITKLQEEMEQAENEDEFSRLKEELVELTKKQDLQNALAQVYVVEGGKYAYIIPNLKGISAEELKDAFGIEDGVIRRYNNNLNYVWGWNDQIDYHNGYRDYTNSTIPYEGIRVPVKELGKAG